jgi:hypothetical protein
MAWRITRMTQRIDGAFTPAAGGCASRHGAGAETTKMSSEQQQRQAEQERERNQQGRPDEEEE